MLFRSMNAFKDNLPQEMKGQLKVVVDQLTAGPAGPLSLKGEGALTDGFLRIKALVAPLETLEAKFTVSELAIMLADGSFSLGKGKVEFSGDIKDYLGRQDFQARIKTNGVDLSQCIYQSKNPVKAKGLVFAEFQLQGQGFDSNALFSKLNGNGSLEIKDGRLTDINILKMVLAKLSFIPHLAETLEANLPERFKEKLQQKDTIVTAFKATAGINDGKVSLQPMNMEADGFLFQADGAVGFDQSYAFDGSFIIPEDLATRMVAVVPQMAYLKDETEQIRFPLRISGKGASVSFMPDIKQIGATVFENKGRQELEKVLDKVFKNRDTSAQVNTPPAVTGEEDKKKDKQQLIRDIIGTILKK